MDPFYDALDTEQAGEIAQLARVMYEAREHRREILEHYATDDAGELLERVAALTAAGESEHPCYEHYLAVCILDQTRSAARTLMAARLKEDDDYQPPHPLHLQLYEALLTSTAISCSPRLVHDALLIDLPDGTELTVRYASPVAYSLRWTLSDGSTLGIDTAPGHRHLDGATQHLHLEDGRVVHDPLTSISRSAHENLHAVLAALMLDPRLSGQR